MTDTKKPLYFLPHLGLGDHFLTNGMLRYMYKTRPRVVMPVKQNNLKAVKRMFSDLQDLYIIPIDGSLEYKDVNHIAVAKSFAAYYQSVGYEVVGLGEFGKNPQAFAVAVASKEVTYDKFFYEEVGLPFEVKWQWFSYPRDQQKEQYIFEQYGVEPFNYAFVHDDPTRGRVINRKHVNPSLKEISPHKRFYEGDIIDYGFLLEHAGELHFNNSAFSDFADFLDLSHVPRICMHEYARPDFPQIYKHKFEVITNDT